MVKKEEPKPNIEPDSLAFLALISTLLSSNLLRMSEFSGKTTLYWILGVVATSPNKGFDVVFYESVAIMSAVFDFFMDIDGFDAKNFKS